ncbi:hypothetical protein QVD17_07048 [Tagetes erecta]|uniref:PWWP domain-containing protein n=1 Tax=Tagetes erecta TaxID=13708 RepID=A0AAD8LN04_TARER|nr:hypothetical protein QVD17_07048 [Tagetes erecta]
MVQDDKDDTEGEVRKNQEQVEVNEVMEGEKEGDFGNLADDGKNDKDEEFMKDQEKGEENEVMENSKEGLFGNFSDDNDDKDEEELIEQGERNEDTENPKEGLFGNLSDDNDDDDDDKDDGMNVDCNENGTSRATDLDGSLADEHGENGSEDPMDVSLSAEKEQNNENGTKTVAMEDLNKNVEENVEIREDDGLTLAENKGEHHDFVVGDFVWGKIKSHPWWPGQIYDASDASDNAAKVKHEGDILVAYFGDGSFSWCSPMQLKPFIDHFPELAKQSDSKKFVNAVKMALGEVNKLLEVELMCKCKPVSRVDGAGVVNRGIKKGVRVPKGNTIKVLMDRMEPVELFSTLKGLATMDPGSGLAELELTLLKSCLNVFYRTRGGYLEEYDTRNNGPSDSVDNGDGKSSQRKQKSVAELLGEDECHEPKIKKTKISKEGGSGKRKRKALVVSVTPESDNESGGAGDGGGVEEDTMSPRQRKKSKYLSPPYLSPISGGKVSIFISGSGSFKEPKLETEKVSEKHHEDTSKSSGKRTRQKRGTREASLPQEEQKTTIDTDLDAKMVLQGLLLVAHDPTSSVHENLNLPEVTGFISSYRSSSFKDGSSCQIDQKKNTEETSDVSCIKQKLESMIVIVQRCDETEMNGDVKASLEAGMQEVLEKVGKLKRK